MDFVQRIPQSRTYWLSLWIQEEQRRENLRHTTVFLYSLIKRGIISCWKMLKGKTESKTTISIPWHCRLLCWMDIYKIIRCVVLFLLVKSKYRALVVVYDITCATMARCSANHSWLTQTLKCKAIYFDCEKNRSKLPNEKNVFEEALTIKLLIFQHKNHLKSTSLKLSSF